MYVLLDGAVRAIDLNGDDRWTWSLGTFARFSATLANDNGRLVLTSGTAIYWLDEKRRVLVDDAARPGPDLQQLTPPLFDAGGTLYVIQNAEDSDSFQPLTQATVFAIDVRHQITWSFPFPRALGARGANLAIGPGNRLYLTVGGKLQAVGP